jgi:penicillin-binding protein 1C
VSPLAALDVPGLLQALDRYPYGCSEQIVSRAMPLLYVNRLASAEALALDDKADERVKDAIERVLARQGSNGAFGLWSAGGDDAWLDAYVADFLTRARERGLAVPQLAFTLVLDRLRNFVANTTEFDKNGPELAYAAYVLARNGRPVMGDLRYLADTKLGAFSTALSRAQIGAALGLLGDRGRSQTVFAAAVEQLRTSRDGPTSRPDYGTRLRDGAGMMALVAEANLARDAVGPLSAVIEEERRSNRATSTQEQAWMILAAQALARDAEALSLSVDGTTQRGSVYRTFAPAALEQKPVSIANTGAAPAQIVVNVTGNPIGPEPAASAGYTVERSYYKLDGTQVSPAQIRQNDRLVTVLKVSEGEARFARLLLVDRLPAGLEIDNPKLVDSGSSGRWTGSKPRSSRPTPNTATTASSPPSTGRQASRRSSPSPTWCGPSRPAATSIPRPMSRTCTARIALAAPVSARSRSRPHGRDAGIMSGGANSRPPCGEERAWRRRVLLTAGGILLALSLALGLALERFLAALGPLDLAVAEQRSTVVLDREGRLLRPFATSDGRWRLPISTADVDPRYVALLKAYEDRRFDRHAGIDPLALVRAGAQLLTQGKVVSGGSTLTMQVARLLEPRDERTLRAKLRQAVRAVQLERRLSKNDVLALYLSLAPYGGNIEGTRAASLAYFGREPKRLSYGEAALLVALPQAPEARRPDRFAVAARRARDRVLDRALARGQLSPEEAAAARAEPLPTARQPFPMLAAHAAEAAIAERPDAPIHRLAIDGRLQVSLEALVRERLDRLGSGLSTAILVLDNRTGEVRAHVGSGGYLLRERSGAIDMAQAVRSPGSALKPFIYALAFENGIAHPETLLDDRPSRYGAYAPENFDLSFQGTVTARRALQLSLNVPAVELLADVGPARFLARLKQAGAAIALPKEAAPGLAVGLGGLGITLTDLTRLTAAFARSGDAPILVRRLDERPAGEAGRVADRVAAWYVADILRGAPPPDNALAGRISFKTGTSYGYRDAWAVGFDRRFTVGVWIGRPDGGAVPGLVGRSVAAPLLFDAYARLGVEPEPIPMPPHALVATTATLPPPLRHLRKDAPKTIASTTSAPLKIAFPLDGSRVELVAAAAGEGPGSLALKASGGVLPLTWLVNGAPIGSPELRRQASWQPDGAGFARVSVMDAQGASASVMVRLE